MPEWALPGSRARAFKASAYSVSKVVVNALCVQYAVIYERDSSCKFNCCCPSYRSTSLNCFMGINPPESGADIICLLATLDRTVSSGIFLNSKGIIPWRNCSMVNSGRSYLICELVDYGR